jgi:ATP-binding cassette subfamily B protein
LTKREFTPAAEYRYNRADPTRWILSHVLRYPLLPLGMVLFGVLANVMASWSRVLPGQAFDCVLDMLGVFEGPVLNGVEGSSFEWFGLGATSQTLLWIALGVLVTRFGQGLFDLARNVTVEFLAQRIERDARDELYVSLLGKSLTFHGRQRVGDLMARATNDVRQLNLMFSPGINLLFDSLVGLVVPIVAIGMLHVELLLVPLIFVVLLGLTLRLYTRELNPVSDALRQQFGAMNAGLAETISGIEVVKANAREPQEQRRFASDAREYRDFFVQRGEIQARYLPLLIYGFAFAGGILQALLLFQRGMVTAGDVVAYVGLLGMLRFSTFISLFTFTLVQMGVSSGARILSVLNTETELDENEAGVVKPIQGEVIFENVSFGYEGQPVLKNISFHARPGETIAIVGQTGSGKTTLTRLIDRIYDVTEGRILVDGVDVRDWNLESLRSQVSAIEQDVFLFSRSIAENIAFGSGQQASLEEIERCARQAQAHEFIAGFPEGYESEVGERGVTLSGGQRQRVAIARAFLADPRILILDDSTSAIDSATEDEIQRAMRAVQQGRTTFIITHRLSQIRWADRILVLRRGELVDEGAHDELLSRCEPYRRIFARYDVELPPLQPPPPAPPPTLGEGGFALPFPAVLGEGRGERTRGGGERG